MRAGHDIGRSGGQYSTPLGAAAACGHKDIVAALIAAGDDGKATDGRIASALTFASQKGQWAVVQLLLENEASPNGKVDWRLESPLLVAARQGHTEVVRLLVNAGASPEEQSRKPEDVNPVEAAVRRGHKQCVAIMLPRASDWSALGGLREASKRKDREMLELFKAYVPDAVMVYAADLGFDDLVIELLERGARTETQLNPFPTHKLKEARGSALVAACATGNLALTRRLLEAGADVNARHDGFGDLYALNTAARSGNAQLVKLLLDHGADVGATGKWSPPLQTAAYRGHQDVVRTLIAYGASLRNSEGSYGGPVQAAVLGHNLQLAQLLVSAGADVNLCSSRARDAPEYIRLSGSPLQAAVTTSQSTVVDWLLEHGADPNICGGTYPGYSRGPPLLLAARAGNILVFEKLLSAGADVDQRYELHYSGTSLYWVVGEDQEEAVKMLLAAGADPNAEVYNKTRTEDFSSLAEACRKGNATIVKALLKAGADVRKYSRYRKHDEPPLHTAARSGNLEVIRALVQEGADVNAQTEEGWTALHEAARSGNDAVVRTLLFDHQADPSLTSSNGNQPIHLAAGHDNPECIRVFQDAGVDANVRNTSNRTVLDCAEESESSKAVQFLRSIKAKEDIQECETLPTADGDADSKLKETSLSTPKGSEMNMPTGSCNAPRHEAPHDR